MDVVGYKAVLRAPLLEVWNNVFRGRPLFRTLDRATWQRHVEGRREEFDRELLRVAVDGERVLGFAHGGIWDDPDVAGGFGATVGSRVAYLCMIAVHPEARRRGVATGLLDSLRQTVERRCGGELVWVADGRMFNPFYGNFRAPCPPLWGTSEGASVLADDTGTRAFLRKAGFTEEARAVTMERAIDEPLPAPPGVSPVTVVSREDYQPELGTDHGTRFVEGNASRTWVALDGELQRGALIAYPLSDREWGIYSLEVEEASRGRGIGELLLRAALTEWQRHGATRVETLTLPEESPAAVRLYERVAFRKSTSWVVFR